MPKKKGLHQLYGGRRPKSYQLAHNHVTHVDWTPHGERGFRRFWIPPQWIGHGWEKCPCGGSGMTHYATKEHVAHWKKLIRKYGSLDAAYQDVHRRLAKHFPVLARLQQLQRRRMPLVIRATCLSFARSDLRLERQVTFEASSAVLLAHEAHVEFQK